MVRTAGLLLALMLLGLVPGLPEALAQTPTRPAAPATLAEPVAIQPDPLPGLPRPADQPQSLFLPPTPVATSADLPGPYCEADPLLDPVPLPQPVWFAAADMLVTAPYVKNRVNNTVQIGNRPPDTVELPSANVDWTVSPRVEVGYRLPSGLGGVAFAYRLLSSQGTSPLFAPDGPATVRSRLELDVFDLDYLSSEILLWPHCDMTWWFGARLANIYFDSQAEEPLAEAAAGSSIFSSRTTDRFLGFGPHWGLALAQRLDRWGLAVVGRLDGWIDLGRIRQGFFEESTDLGPDGLPLTGESHVRSSQAVPMVNAQFGLGWQPPGHENIHVFAGYQYEHWWNVGRLNELSSKGELEDQGILLRADVNF